MIISRDEIYSNMCKPSLSSSNIPDKITWYQYPSISDQDLYFDFEFTCHSICKIHLRGNIRLLETNV